MDRSPLTPSLCVPDVAKAVRFYVEILGFAETANWVERGEPIWAEVARDGPCGTARLWFFSDLSESPPAPMLSGLIYLFVEDVDAEAARLSGWVKARWGPETQEYGLREFGFEDLNGYLICLARDV